MIGVFAKRMGSIVPHDSPRYLLHKLLSDYQEPRTLKNVHGSEVTKDGGICARMYGLADLTGTEKSAEWLTTSQAVTYELGHLLEARIINWFADIGIAYSNWQCQSCGNTFEFCKRPVDCEHCGNTGFRPENYRVTSAKTGISCGLDLMLRMKDQPLLRLIEIKTMDKDEFKELKAPLAEHRIRTNLYMRCIEESDDWPSAKINFKQAIILYVTKGGFGVKDPQPAKWGLHDSFSPFKEYAIERNDSDTDELVTPAYRLLQFRNGKEGLAGPICSTALTERAKTCPLRKACFSGDWPAGIKAGTKAPQK